MQNLDELLKEVEKNYENRNKKEKVVFETGGKKYEVLLLSRTEKFDLIFQQSDKMKTAGDLYKWLKPVIYKSFQLKDLALKAHEAGYIKEYYGIIDILFEPNEILQIIDFILKINCLRQSAQEMVELQKK